MRDLYFNNSVQALKESNQVKQEHVLLNRFIRLLIWLESKDQQVTSVEQADLMNGLFPLNPSARQIQAGANLAKDREFLLRLMVLQIAKHHNLFSEADRHMRQFARICFGF